MGTAGRKVTGSAGDPRINLAPVVQTQEASCWCTKDNIDPADLVVIIVFIITTNAYCTLAMSEHGTMLSMLLTLCHLILNIAL